MHPVPTSILNNSSHPPLTIPEDADFLAVPADTAAAAAAAVAVAHTPRDTCRSSWAAVPVGIPGNCTPLEEKIKPKLETKLKNKIQILFLHFLDSRCGYGSVA